MWSAPLFKHGVGMQHGHQARAAQHSHRHHSHRHHSKLEQHNTASTGLRRYMVIGPSNKLCVSAWVTRPVCLPWEFQGFTSTWAWRDCYWAEEPGDLRYHSELSHFDDTEAVMAGFRACGIVVMAWWVCAVVTHAMERAPSEDSLGPIHGRAGEAARAGGARAATAGGARAATASGGGSGG